MFVSADLDEVLQYSDRVLVFFAGRMSPPLPADGLSVERLGELIGGKGWERLRRGGGMRSARISRAALQVAAIVLALLLTTLVLLAAHAPPFAAYANIVLGAVGSWEVAANVLVAWVPLLLATAGLLVTFTAGLWNIGIEGQITLGAVFTTWVLRALQASSVRSRAHPRLRVVAGHGGRRALGNARRGAEDLRRGERDLRRAGPELRGLRAQPLAHLRAVEEAGRRLHVGNGALPPALWMATVTPQSRLSLSALVIAILGIAPGVRDAPRHALRPEAEGRRDAT